MWSLGSGCESRVQGWALRTETTTTKSELLLLLLLLQMLLRLLLARLQPLLLLLLASVNICHGTTTTSTFRAYAALNPKPSDLVASQQLASVSSTCGGGSSASS